MKYQNTLTLFVLITFGFICNIRTVCSKPKSGCPSKNMCKSKYDYCGVGPEYCGKDCQSGPCTEHTNNGVGNKDHRDIINDKTFGCVFNSLDTKIRGQRLGGLKKSNWKPHNADEAAVFLAHVYHETGGLSTLTEHCAPNCPSTYAQTWCKVKPAPGKFYYGRGWFQLSYPCNYEAAGKFLKLDLLNHPDRVDHEQDIAVKTAVWFYNTNKMAAPARKGDFAATTRIINGKVECNGASGAVNQKRRVETYKRIRKCFGLGDPKINPTC